MRRVVIDAAAFVEWFTGDDPATRREYEAAADPELRRRAGPVLER